ncbi:hypothetical protein V1264_021714 [Littorina saxatilis]|uniref:Major facilitator superfamily (MFS) profile domain-containing protein n=1 Tax=Littorina saxatilis TaxID=31220 RepID=A0AAN9AIT5_9CAEN
MEEGKANDNTDNQNLNHPQSLSQNSPEPNEDSLVSNPQPRTGRHETVDGGWGWVVVFASFFIAAVVDGVGFSMGIFFTTFEREFGTTKMQTSLVSATLNGVCLIVGPLVSVFVTRYGCRGVAMFGSVLGAVAFVVSTFSPSIEVLIITYGLIGGLGLGFLYQPAIVIVGYYFLKRRALALGVTNCGSGVGAFAFAPLFYFLIETFSWKVATYFSASMVLLCVCACATFRPIQTQLSKCLSHRSLHKRISLESYEMNILVRASEPQRDALEEELLRKAMLSQSKEKHISTREDPSAEIGGGDGAGDAERFDTNENNDTIETIASSSVDTKVSAPQNSSGNTFSETTFIKKKDSSKESMTSRKNRTQHSGRDLTIREKRTTYTDNTLSRRRGNSIIAKIATSLGSLDVLQSEQGQGSVKQIEAASLSKESYSKRNLLEGKASHNKVSCSTKSSIDSHMGRCLTQRRSNSILSKIATSPGSLPDKANTFTSSRVNVQASQASKNETENKMARCTKHAAGGTETSEQCFTATRKDENADQNEIAAMRHVIQNYPLEEAMTRIESETSLKNIYKDRMNLQTSASMPGDIEVHTPQTKRDIKFLAKEIASSSMTEKENRKHSQHQRRKQHNTDVPSMSRSSSSVSRMNTNYNRTSDSIILAKIATSLGSLDTAATRGGEEHASTSRVTRNVRGFVWEPLKPSVTLMKRPCFVLFSIVCFLISIGMYVPTTFLPHVGEECHIASSKAALLISVVGIGNVVARLAVGPIVDRYPGATMHLNNGALLLAGGMTCLVPMYTHYPALVVYSFFFGASMGVYVAVQVVILIDLLGLNELTAAFGLANMYHGIGVLIGPPLAGYVWDSSGNVHYLFYVIGSIMTLSGIISLPLQRISSWEIRRRDRVSAL